MSLSLKISSQSSPQLCLLHHLGFNKFPYVGTSRVSIPFHLHKLKKNCFLKQKNRPTLCSISAHTGHNKARSWADKFLKFLLDSLDHEEKTENSPRESLWSDDDPRVLELLFRVMENIERYPISGLLSFVLINIVHYLTTCLFVRFYVTPVPGRIGYGAAVGRFFKVMTLVWVVSKLTERTRVGMSHILTSFVEKTLSWFTVKFEYASKREALRAIVEFCTLALTIIVVTFG